MTFALATLFTVEVWVIGILLTSMCYPMHRLEGEKTATRLIDRQERYFSRACHLWIIIVILSTTAVFYFFWNKP